MASTPGMATGDEDTINWLVGGLLFLGIIFMVTKTKTGYAVVYYALLLLVVFMFVSQYKWISTELSYFSKPMPTGLAGGGSVGNLNGSGSVRTYSTGNYLPTNVNYGAGGIITTF